MMYDAWCIMYVCMSVCMYMYVCMLCVLCYVCMSVCVCMCVYVCFDFVLSSLYLTLFFPHCTWLPSCRCVWFSLDSLLSVSLSLFINICHIQLGFALSFVLYRHVSCDLARQVCALFQVSPHIYIHTDTDTERDRERETGRERQTEREREIACVLTTW